MKALLLNCSLKPSLEPSNTEALASIVLDALRKDGVETEMILTLDHRIAHGVRNDRGDGDQWQALHDKIPAAGLFLLAIPTCMAQPNSVSHLILVRMDAMNTGTNRRAPWRV